MSGWLSFTLVLFALATLFGLWFASPMQSRGRWLGRPVDQQIHWEGRFDAAFQRSLYCLAACRAELKDADPSRGLILGATGPGILSGGTTFRVELRMEEGVTYVNVRAAASACLFDWGVSNRLLDQFLEHWGDLPLDFTPTQ